MGLIKVIGKVGCSKCFVAKMKLDKRNIDYEYSNLNVLPADERRKYVNLAREDGKATFPIIIKDGELCTVEEILKG